MKKIYSLFMALSIVLCASANSTFTVEQQLDLSNVSKTKLDKQINPAKVDAQAKLAKQANFGREAARQLSAQKVQGAPTANLNGVREYKATNVMNFEKQKLNNTAKKVAAKRTDDATAPDTVVIPADQFFYKYYADTYDWFIAIADADMTYVINLDYYSDSFAGSFTEEDMDMYYSYIQYFDEEGYTNYIDIEEATLVVTDDENGKSADVTILGSDGKVYVSYAYEAPIPEAKGEKTLAYTTAELLDFTLSSGMWQFWAEENGWYTSIVMAAEQVEGEYTRMDMVDPLYNYLAYFTETDTTIIDMLDINAKVTREGKTWTLVADALGTDTIMYHITMSYTKPDPVDTVSIVATDLYIDEFEFWGYVFTSAEASNDEYRVYLSVNNQYLTAGEYTSGDFSLSSCEITDKVAKEEIGLTEVNVTVAGEGNARTIVGEVVGDNNVLYQLDLSYVVPEVADTVVVVFETLGVAEWYDADSDYFIYNENEEYFVYLDMITEKNNFVGEFAAEDFLLNYTAMGEIVDGDTTTILAADAKAVVTAVSESLVHIEAEITGKNGTLYLVSTDVQLPGVGLKYDAEVGGVDRTYSDATDVAIITTDYVAQYGELYLELMAGDNSDYVQLLFYVEETAEGTVIPVGTYTIDDSEDYGTVAASTGYNANYGPIPSYYTTLVTKEDGLYYGNFFFLVSGNVTVEEVDGSLKITVIGLNSYNCPVHIVYTSTPKNDNDKTPLQYDATEGAVDRNYTTEEITINKGEGYFQVLAYAADGTDMAAMLLFGQEDENTIIPVGTYKINATEEDGTVLASEGVSGNSITLSFYGKTNAQGQISVPCWFMVDGTVVVTAADGKLNIEVNALNSNNVPVHLVMVYDLNTKQGLQYDMTEGSLNVTYTDNDDVEIITDYLAEDGVIYLDITAANGSNTTSVAFFAEKADSVITIPAGTYPINDTQDYGTVMSSPGVQGGYIYPSFYGNLNAQGQILIPCYFMVSGNVVVENINGHLKVTINALNSYDVPATIVYEASATAVENIVTGDNINTSKVVENNQLFIIKEGVKYNVLGTVVK